MVDPHDLRIPIAGDQIHALHHRAAGTPLKPSSRPCVVMAHGIAATQDSGLDGFVCAFVNAGIDVITFDYRHFAESSGAPRCLVDPARQIADYHAVIAAARTLEGVDPDRIAVWGVSFSGGHVFHLAAQDPRLAAMIALTPATDGRAVTLQMARTQGVGYALSMGRAALRDALAACLRRQPVTVPVVGPPGSISALNSPGAEEGMYRIAGPSWRNEFAARLFLAIPRYRPIRVAAEVRCPALVQIADLDQTAPPRPATVAGERARARVHHYLCDHFDVYTGQSWHDLILADQVAFLRRVLAIDETFTSLAPVKNGPRSPDAPVVGEAWS